MSVIAVLGMRGTNNAGDGAKGRRMIERDGDINQAASEAAAASSSSGPVTGSATRAMTLRRR